MAKTIRVQISEKGNADKLLGTLPVELRQKVLVKALKKGANIVAKEARRLAPVGDKPKAVRLKDTIATKTVQYAEKVLTITGPRYGRGLGNHGHLVEFGHRKVLWGRRTSGFVQGKPFLRPAADVTQTAQQSAIIGELRAHARTISAT